MIKIGQRKFCRFPFPDDRDKKFRLRKLKTERTSRYWRDNWWKDADQGNEPACTGYAAVGWLSSSPISQWINPDGVYRLATYVDEWEGSWEDYEGTSVRAVMKVLQMLGFISEYRWETKVNLLLPHLLEKSSIVLGTNWYAGMSEPDKDGLIKPTGMLCGGHSYLWTGANTKTRMARIKNGWGDSWGKNGHAFITFDDLDLLLSQEGEACAGIETKPAA